MREDGDSGTSARSPGDTGSRAMWQWTPPRGWVGGEGQRAGKHLVKGDTQGVEIAAGVHGAVHAARLLGGHIGERAGNYLGRDGRLMLARQLGRDPQTREPGG